MATKIISPNYFGALTCEADTYAGARAGANGLTSGWQYMSVGQAYRESAYNYNYHIERLVTYFNLTSLVGKLITSVTLHVKFHRGTVTGYDNDWNWNLKFRANPPLNLGSAFYLANFLAALGGDLFATKHVGNYPDYEWHSFNVLAYVTAPTFTFSVVSDKDAASTAPEITNTAEAADFKNEFFSPGQTDRVKLVIEYEVTEVETNPATNVGASSATLNGTLTDDGGEACACGFEYGLTDDYGDTTPTQNRTTGQTFSQDIAGLIPGSTYHFRAKATNTAGTVYGDDLTFTCPGYFAWII